MEFKTQFIHGERVFSNPGSPTMNEYAMQYDKKTGAKDLVKTGETDIHARIQVDKDSCDINLIVKRFTQGETDALNKVKGIYLDTTDYPTNYAEFLQRVSDCNAMFDKLPVEVKEQFNNSADEFWTQFGNDEWVSKLGLEKVYKETGLESIDEPVPSDVKEVAE